MKPYNLVNTHKTVHSFSTYNKTYFKKNEFSIPLTKHLSKPEIFHTVNIFYNLLGHNYTTG